MDKKKLANKNCKKCGGYGVVQRLYGVHLHSTTCSCVKENMTYKEIEELEKKEK